MEENNQDEQQNVGKEQEHVTQCKDYDVSNVPESVPGALMESPDAIIQKFEQRIREDLTLTKDTSAERHSFMDKKVEGREDQLADARHLTSLYASLKQSPFLDMSVDGIRRWLTESKDGNENAGSSDVVNEDDLNTEEEDLELRKSANSKALLEINSLLTTVSQDVNGLKRCLAKDYKYLEAFEIGADKLGTNGGMEACLNDDLNDICRNIPQNMRRNSDLITKQPENLEELESTIKHLEEKLEQNERDYLEAEAAMESRIKEYDQEIADLHAQAIQLDKEEQRMRILISIISKYLDSQRHLECSNDVSVVSVDNGCVELQLITYISGREDQTASVSQLSNSFLEHNLHIKINQETMEIEEAKLTPDDVPMRDLLSVVQEKRNAVKLFGSTQNGELSTLGPQLVSLVTAIHDWQTTRASEIASGRQRSANCKISVETHGKSENHESRVKDVESNL